MVTRYRFLNNGHLRLAVPEKIEGIVTAAAEDLDLLDGDTLGLESPHVVVLHAVEADDDGPVGEVLFRLDVDAPGADEHLPHAQVFDKRHRALARPGDRP